MSKNDKDLNNFIPKDVKTRLSFNPSKFDRAGASDGDVDRFINYERFGLLHSRKKSARLHQLEREQAKTGTPFMYRGRLRNPVKLNISDSTMEKIRKGK